MSVSPPGKSQSLHKSIPGDMAFEEVGTMRGDRNGSMSGSRQEGSGKEGVSGSNPYPSQDLTTATATATATASRAPPTPGAIFGAVGVGDLPMPRRGPSALSGSWGSRGQLGFLHGGGGDVNSPPERPTSQLPGESGYDMGMTFSPKTRPLIVNMAAPKPFTHALSKSKASGGSGGGISSGSDPL